MDKDNSDNASDEDSEGNYKEKMPQKKIRKFVAEEEQEGESEMKNQNQDGKDEENESVAKTEVAAKQETRTLPSNPEEVESERMIEFASEQKKEIGDKNVDSGKPKAGFTASV